MKRFITCIPLQPEASLHSVRYHSEESRFLQYEGKTRFPIMIAVAKAAKAVNELIEVIAITKDGAEAVPHNFELFKSELQDLSETQGFRYEITEIKVSYDEKIDTQLHLFSDIACQIQNNDNIYACITYGSKAVPILMLLAINYAYKLKDNTTVECVVYGQYDHINNRSEIFDVSSLLYMNSMIDTLSTMKPKDPYMTIKEIIDSGK